MGKLDKLATLIPMEELEYDAQKQVYDALELPFLRKLAIMPDCHTGYHLPIGAVALLDNVVSPSYVGYDIGCGMCCIITDADVPDWSEEEKEAIRNLILRIVPVGFSGHSIHIPYAGFNSMSMDKELNQKVNTKLGEQLGTLGSGNHFIEIGANQDNKLAITIHSGSRNSGHSVGDFYMKLSKTEDKDLPQGFFHLEREFGQAYLYDMNFMLQYALDNRRHMMERVLSILGLGKVRDYNMLNENHNHAIVLYDQFVLHRKGATPADEGQYGVIPGNMRDGVIVTEGLGNEDFLSSASHGAGRTMSRKKAKEQIDIDTAREQLKGITCEVSPRMLDEAPDAYKDLDTVIGRQAGIVVEVVDYIKPIINVKG